METPDVHPNQSEDEDSDPDIRKLEGNAQKLRPCLKLKNSLTMLSWLSDEIINNKMQRYKDIVTFWIQGFSYVGSNELILVMSAELFKVSLRTFRKDYMTGNWNFFF